MGLGKVLKKVARFAAPAAMIAFPGIGAALGTALGATGATASALGSGLIGAGTGALTGGGVKGAALGGALGGLGGYAQGGGFSGVGTQGGGLLTSGASPTGSILDLSSGTGNLLTQGGGLTGNALNVANLAAPLNIAGGTSTALSNLPSYTTSTLGSRLSDMFGGEKAVDIAKNLYSGVQSNQTYKDIAKAQLAANQQAQSSLSPYMATGTAANERLAALLGLTGDGNNEDVLSALRNTPGYQFRMQEGQNALNSNLGSRGKYFSGEALKASQEFGQGIADQTYNDLLKSLASQSSQGLSAAGTSGLYSTAAGDIQANKILGQSNTYNELLNSIFNPVRY